LLILPTLLNLLKNMPFILINKPKDWTSHDVVSYIRNIVNRQTGLPTVANKAKVGHAGTLDPFATGLLIVGIEREATKRLDDFKNLPKTYIAKIKLGAVSDTQDSTGNISKKSSKKPTTKEIEKVLKSFIGKQEQLPPMYSAKKIKGKKLYELARKGIEIERKPNEIEIYDIKLLEYSHPIIKIEVSCSTGTYIRTLANDIGETLKTGAYCDELERTKIGNYSVKDAVDVKNASKENFLET